MQIAPQHPEAVSQGTGVGVKERFFLDGVALHAGSVAPRYVELPAPVEADFAHPDLAVRNRTAMTAGKTPHKASVELFVKLTFANALVEHFFQGRHRKTPRSFLITLYSEPRRETAAARWPDSSPGAKKSRSFSRMRGQDICHSGCYMGLRPTDGHESPPSLSFLAQIDMTLRLTLYMKMREALRSGVACYRFYPGQLAGRGRVYRAFGERGRERARGIKAAASCRTPQRLRRLTPVFSIEASPIFMAARNLLLIFFSQKQIPRRYAPRNDRAVG